MLKLFYLIKRFSRGGPEGRPGGPMVGQGGHGHQGGAMVTKGGPKKMFYAITRAKLCPPPPWNIGLIRP